MASNAHYQVSNRSGQEPCMHSTVTCSCFQRKHLGFKSSFHQLSKKKKKVPDLMVLMFGSQIYQIEVSSINWKYKQSYLNKNSKGKTLLKKENY